MRRRPRTSSRLLGLLAGTVLAMPGACATAGDEVGADGPSGAAGVPAPGAFAPSTSAAAGASATAGAPASNVAGAGAAGTGEGGAGAAATAGAGAGGGGASGGAGSAGAAGASGAGGAAGSAAAPVDTCDRACLTDFNTAYLDALVARDATRLPFAASARFTENGEELPLGQGLWTVVAGLRGYRQDFAEVPAGQSAGFAALDDDQGVVLLAFRLRIVMREITELETIVVRQGEATFFAPQNLDVRDPLYDAELPAASRLPRADMIEVVDGYFQGIETGDGSAIPVDSSAARNENGTVTARGGSIQNLAMFSYIETVERRYALVDEERGIVLPFVLFHIPNGLGGSRTLHMAELFKVEDGTIMDILAIMVNRPLGTTSGWE